MIDYQDYFKNKKVLVMGLGLLGRGIGVTKFLAENGAKVTVTDLKTKGELEDAVKEINIFIKTNKLKAISYKLGGHNIADIKQAGLIIRAANVPIDSPYLKEVKKNKITVTQDATLFAQLVGEGVKIIGITGTRGKSTVTHLLYEILKANGRRVWLGGNVRGTATLPLLKKVKPGDVVVMELDSWQLQSFGDSKISPSLAIFTSFMNDHQNYYGSTSLTTGQNGMRRYFEDKANIFKYQKAGDILIVGRNNFGPESFKLPEAIKQLKPKSTLKVISETDFPKNWRLKLLGKHSRYNTALAYIAARALSVPESVIKKTVENFAGLPGRLELVANKGGIKYYNDTTATTPEAAMAALHALASLGLTSGNFPRLNLGRGSNLKRIILLAGGADKELNYDHWGKVVPKYLKELILFKGSATEKILKVLPKKARFEIKVVENMKEAIRQAQSLAAQGDIVLLSPGAASFGIFKNEFDRGDQFNKLVKAIKK